MRCHLAKEQSVLTKARSSFERENVQTQDNVLGYRVGLYFHDYKPAIEIDENRLSDRNIDYEIKRQRPIKQELGCKLIRTDPDKKIFYKIFGGSKETKLPNKHYNFYLAKIYFTSNDGSQNMFVYQPTLDTLELRKEKGTNCIFSWKVKRVYTSKRKPLCATLLHSIKL